MQIISIFNCKEGPKNVIFAHDMLTVKRRMTLGEKRTESEREGESHKGKSQPGSKGEGEFMVSV